MNSINRKTILVFVGTFFILLFFLTETYAKPYKPFEPSWDETNIKTAFDPINRRGHNPVYKGSSIASALGTLRQSLEDDGGAGSANFQLTVPVINLAGRGLDLSLALHYNSRLWHKAEKMIFDVDGDWPAPGWSLGFGKIVKNMLIDADGTRHPFKKAILNNEWVYHTLDGSLIQYNFYGDHHAVVRYPNGTVTYFEAYHYPFSTFYPTKITDANGNYITITYRKNLITYLDTITDTLGRVIRFHYDHDNLLTAIEGPDLNGTSRTLIRLHYRKMTLHYGFSSILIGGCSTPQCNEKPKITVDVIDAIYYPNTRTGYWFRDGDSFSSYGMLRKVTEQRGMVFNATSLTDQGKIDAGVITRKRLYDYPINPDNSLTDAPSYQNMVETWEGMDTPQAVTHYVINKESSPTPRRIEVTYPDGSRSVQFLHNNPYVFDYGLVYQIQTFDDMGNVLGDNITTWEKGEDDAARVHRIEKSIGTGKPIAVEYSYGAAHNAVTEVRNYDYGESSSTEPSSTDDIFSVLGEGDIMSGGGIVIGNIDGSGRTDIALTAVDNWTGGNDYWRIAIGSDCVDIRCSWSSVKAVTADADVLSSSAVAAADFNGDGKLDLFLSGIDNWSAGNDYWRYRIGTDCNTDGNCTWSEIQVLEAGADKMSGGGVAVGQLDADPRPDVVIVGVDNWYAGNDYWRYRIGMNCNADGHCTWSEIQVLNADATNMSGGGVAIGDLDGNGIQEIVIVGIDNWSAGNDYWRYRIGTGCNADGNCTWSEIQFLEDGAVTMSGGGVTLADLTGDGNPEIMVSAIADTSFSNVWRYCIGNGCDVSRGNCTWNKTMTADSGVDLIVGGGITAEGHGKNKAILSAINQRGDLDFWRLQLLAQATGSNENPHHGATSLRRMTTEYETDLGYAASHIFNLPKVIQVYDGASSTPSSRIEYNYDTTHLALTRGIVSHSEDFNPYQTVETTKCIREERVCDDNRKPPCKMECVEEKTETTTVYNDRRRYRGNLTSIKGYADAAHLTGAITVSHNYDMAGNLIAVSTEPGEQTSFGYTAATQYAYPSTVTRGAADSNSPVKLKTSSTYDFNTGLTLTTTDVNGQTTQFEYYPDTLLPNTTLWPTGAKTVYEYDFSSLTSTKTLYNFAGLVTAKNANVMNGIGLSRHTETIADGNQLDIVETKYDVMGRPWQQSQPYRIGQTPQWSETNYDALGRVTLARAADGSTSRYYYNETSRPSDASGSPGETTRTEDPWGRQHWLRTNASGQLAEVIEPNPYGSGSLTIPNQVRTTYAYNALDQVVSITRPPQLRSFQYDSLGRLTHQYLPENNPTLNDNGGYGGGDAKWSDVFKYDYRSNLSEHIDARGIKTVYHYDNDPLDRLQSVTYDMAGFGDTSNPVLPVSPVTYEYMQTGDITRIFRVKTQDLSTKENTYVDSEGRLSSTTITFDNQPNYPLTVDYSYDEWGRIKDLRYPLSYGATNSAAKTLHYDYGVANQLKSLTMNGLSYASDFIYNAAGQVTAMNIGPAGANQVAEYRDFDPATGMMTGQRVSRSGTPLLNLSYDYLRRDFVGRPDGGATGQLTRIVDNSERWNDQTFNYDAWGRLKSVQTGKTGWPPNPVHLYEWRQEYQYDQYGNRTSVKALGPPRFCPLGDPNCTPGQAPELPPEMRDGLGNVSYDAKTNHISLPGFIHDAAGNLTRSLRVDGKWQKYQYDAAGRLAEVRNDNDDVIEHYYYDGASNKRLITKYASKWVGRESYRYYVWNNNTIIAEYEVLPAMGWPPRHTNPTWRKSYVSLGERLLATIAPDANGLESIQFHHPGHLGTRLITDPSTGSAIKQEHYPFGTAMPGVKSATNRVFTSYDRSDLTKLDYAVNRFYDSSIGRFTQADPLGMGAIMLDDPQSLNMYAYVNNDPVNLTDLTGLKFVLKPSVRCEAELDGMQCINTWVTVWVPDNPDTNVPKQTRDPSGDKGRGGGGARGRNRNKPLPVNATPANACQGMAQVAQVIAQQAIASNPGNDRGALRDFDDVFNSFYNEGPFRGLTGGMKQFLTHGNGRMNAIYSPWWGESGFQRNLWDSLDRRHEINVDQTHHFAMYLSGGSNVGSSPSIEIGKQAHLYWDFLQNNSGDVLLGMKAYYLGERLAADPGQLANVGSSILSSICTP